MGIVLDWQKKLGYKADPFLDAPTAQITGLESIKEKINLFLLREERIFLIRADKGMGKSSFLKWLEHELKSARKLHLLDLKTYSSREKLESYFDTMSTPLFRRFLKDERTKEQRLEQIKERFSKTAYLFAIEDAHLLNPAQIALLDDIMDATKTQLILFDTNAKKSPLKMSATTVSIDEYSNEEIQEILKTRIEAAGSVGTFPFDEKTLSVLCKEKTPRDVLLAARHKAMELSLKNLALPQKEVKEVAQKVSSEREEIDEKEGQSQRMHDAQRKTHKATQDLKGKKASSKSVAEPSNDDLVNEFFEKSEQRPEVEKKKGFRLFNIRFERKDDDERMKEDSKKDSKKAKESKSKGHGEDDQESESTLMDAEMLKKIVEGR